MTFRVKFSEQGGSFRARFGAVQIVSDGGSVPVQMQTKSVDIIQNGTISIEPDAGYLLEKVVANVDIPCNKDDEDAIIRRSIKQYSNDRVVSVGAQAFYGCAGLVEVYFAKAEIISSNGFRGCSALVKADFEKVTTINANAFYGDSSLTQLIIRSDTVCRLVNVSALTGSAVESGTGFVFVPDNLVADYKIASNWSTFAAQIKPLSELEE